MDLLLLWDLALADSGLNVVPVPPFSVDLAGAAPPGSTARYRYPHWHSARRCWHGEDMGYSHTRLGWQRLILLPTRGRQYSGLTRAATLQDNFTSGTTGAAKGWFCLSRQTR